MQKKVFIIGNGFDLAHDLKTSYADLLNYHSDRVFSEVNQNGYYEDSFFKVEFEYPLNSGFYQHSRIQQYMTSQGFIEFMSIAEKMSNVSFTKKNDFYFLIRQRFLEANWVDIECLYFEELKNHLHNPAKAKKLNSEFAQIQNLLSDYLCSLNYHANEIVDFHSIFQHDSTLGISSDQSSRMFLNFNYTNTINQYLKDNVRTKELIHIHGELKSEENPIIFGFGDEHSEDYKLFENSNNSEFLRFIKYPRYTLTNNYRKLELFLAQTSGYEVSIIGHSCGLSDRTILRRVLDNDKCTQIRIYPYKDGDNYLQVVTELTRHFRDKTDYLRKTIPYDSKTLCPQFKTK